MSRPQMFLIAGVNGSGKTSFTRNITRKHPTLKVIDPDAIAKGMTGSFSTIDAEAVLLMILSADTPKVSRI